MNIFKDENVINKKVEKFNYAEDLLNDVFKNVGEYRQLEFI